MATRPYPPAVRLTAEGIAGEWLRTHGYCDCANQEQIITRRILPAVGIFEEEIDTGTPGALEMMSGRLAVYLTRRHAELSKGLHRPGSSALEPQGIETYRPDGNVN